MIKVNFSTYGTYVTDSLYQWDINRRLIVNGLNLEQAPEIHFYNANMERAIVRQATLDNGVATVTIPNALLQEALTIKADVCIYEDDVRKTIEDIEIPVKAKARPLDYVFEDDGGDVYSYNALITKFNEHIRTMEAILQEAKDRYDELLDEIGQVVGEYPGLPDRVAELENKNEIQFTWYEGNGKRGISDPCSVTFPVAPRIVVAVLPYCNVQCTWTMVSDELTTEYVAGKGFKLNTSEISYGKKSKDGKTFSWYTQTVEGQLNNDKEKYYFYGLGLAD